MSDTQTRAASADASFAAARPSRIRAVVLAAVLLVGALLTWSQLNRYPKRFAVVAPGEIYRSGEVRPPHLERLKAELNLKTVLSLLNPEAPESVAEQEAAERLGIVYLNVPLRGNGASTPPDRDRIREILFDESHRPLLVHCSAGANRTGLTIGMYRLYHDGWTYEQVLAEMKQFDFEDEAHHENLRAALRAEAERAAAGGGPDAEPDAAAERP